MHKPLVTSGGRYPVLRALALLYLIGAGLAVLAGIVACGWILIRANDVLTGKLILMAGALVATFFVCISLLAIAEVLKLFMDIEHNSRMLSGSAAVATDDGRTMAGVQHTNRVSMLDEETAEGALLRGH
jgi:hypothetical protein